MIARLILVFIAWRIARRLLLVAALIALAVAAMHSFRAPRTERAHRRETTVDRVLAPIEQEAARAIGGSR